MGFHFRADKKRRLLSETVTPDNGGDIKMHEMGQRFKCCSRKAPFVLTECEIAHGVCGD